VNSALANHAPRRIEIGGWLFRTNNLPAMMPPAGEPLRVKHHSFELLCKIAHFLKIVPPRRFMNVGLSPQDYNC
jgi:hypothetical protein